MKISFTVHSLPIAQPRQRHSVMNVGGRNIVRNYTPKNDPVNLFKAAIQQAAAQIYSGPPLDEPLKLELTLVFERPKALIYKSRPMPRVPKTTKPDWDNLGKSVCDALNGLLYRDDSLIYSALVTKMIAAGDEQAHAVITIETI